MSTPFGEKMKALRAQKNVTLKEMATALGISSAYLCALEQGKKGRPSIRTMHLICQYFEIIWDEAEQLERLALLSQDKHKIECSDCSHDKRTFVYELSQNLQALPDELVSTWLKQLKAEL